MRAAALVMPSALVFVGVLVPSVVIFFELPDLGNTVGSVVFMILFGICALPFVFLRSGIKHFRNALAERPTDIVLGDGDHVTIVGGQRNGQTFDARRCTIADEDHTTFTNKTIRITALGFEGTVVARAARAIEQESLQALHATLVAHGTTHDTKPLRETAPSLLVCAHCDGPAVPDDAEHVACRFCNAEVTVPEPLREKIRAARTLATEHPRNARMIARLLRQPSARAVWIAMVALGAPMLLVWPACAIGCFVLDRRGLLTALDVVVFLVAGMVAIGALFVVMRLTLVNRQALSLLSTRFSALPPDKPGAPPLCRNCQAPLPGAADGQMLVRCAYCDADNILGLDVRARAGTEVAQQRSIDVEISRRRDEHRLWRTAAFGAIVAVVGLRWLVPYTFRPHTDPARCRAGDVAACIRAGERSEHVEHAYNEDIRDALAFYRLGCQAHDQQSCRAAARVAYSWNATVFAGYVDTVPDLRAGCEIGDARACSVAAMRIDDKFHPHDFFELAVRACDLGDADGCTNVGYAYENGEGAPKDMSRALASYTLACDRGNLLGCANAGVALEHATPPDPARAAALFDRACPADTAKRDTEVCGNAAAFYRRRCDTGDAAACARAQPPR